MSATPTVIPGSSAPTRPLSLDANRTKAGTRRRRRRGFGLTLLLAACSLTVLVPLYVTVSMALKSGSQAVDGEAFALPAPPSLEGIIEAWSLTNFPRAFAISVFVTTVTVVGTILLSSMAAYAISRNWHRRVFRWSFFYLLAAMFLPFPVLALSQVKLSGMAGLAHPFGQPGGAGGPADPFGVAILHILFQLSFSVMLYTAFLRGLPEELEESARLDGASTAQVFWRIVFALLAPMSATVGIFSFLASWNDFMMPSLIIADPSLQTLPVVQSIFQTQFSNNYHVAFSSYLMAMAPAVIVYLFTQRWVMSGVTQGAVK